VIGARATLKTHTTGQKQTRNVFAGSALILTQQMPCTSLKLLFFRA
jgi:hypothetical protein